MRPTMIVFRGHGEPPHELPHDVPVSSATLRSATAWRVLNGHGVQPGIVYVQHPRTPGALLTYAGFHPYIEEERVQCALTLVTALGASRVLIKRVSAADSSFKFNLPALAVKVFGEGRVQRESVDSYEVTREGRGARPRRVPPLTWTDVSWEGLEDAVRRGAVSKHQLVVENRESLGIGATLGTRFKKRGLSLGGEFQRVSNSNYRLEVEFPTFE